MWPVEAIIFYKKNIFWKCKIWKKAKQFVRLMLSNFQVKIFLSFNEYVVRTALSNGD